MDTSIHTLKMLFLQLGLKNSDDAMSEFIASHQLSKNQAIEKANFWNTSQAQFISESWNEDADWCVIVDQLNSLLHQKSA
ncbi:DUF2789 domain-containing protein [Lentisphaera profundi]|uniref:DUF2789 domain-containing protein n=1 Tax=Lentisphaera profundi TaxID=1658616 RepID=A0ABY7VUL4_9BACT|nr:DUF2789 domain-containing protein [Lentisphaera profundi]WDE97890.1 DUF2789 domain-containing protein [Lentisphaera profundi]